MKKRNILLLIFIVILLITGIKSFLQADDEDLFSVKVKPNILFILDNSGSMESADVYVSDYQDFGTYTTSTGKTYTYPYYSCTAWSSGHCVSAYVRRYIAMRRITTELLDTFRNDAYLGIENFFYIGGGSDRSLGGQIHLTMKDLSTPDRCEDTVHPNTCTEHLDMMFDIVNHLTADYYTPLAESLDTAYGYYKGIINSTDGNTFYDMYNFPRCCSEVDNYGNCTNSTASSPVRWWCQKNFVILVTDGAPTSDEFDNNYYLSYRYYPYINDLNTYRWDYDGDGDGSDTKTKYGHLLDDVAKYIYDVDLIPDDKNFFNLGSDYDPGFNEKQNIITYTVGLRINIALLQNTADNGHGKYYTVSDFDQLKTSLLNAIYNILERSFAFTSFTAPKKIASAGAELNVSYVGSFIPKHGGGIWDGHLKAYNLDDEGEFTGERWDAASKIPDPANRDLYTLNSNLSITEFSTNHASELRTLLDVSTVSDASDIINFIRGVRGDNDPPYLLGDIFHSDIQFVGTPLAWKKALDPSYETFYENYKDRKKVLYVGTNDGIIHEIDTDPDVDPSDEGKEIYGFVPDEVLPNLKKIVFDKEHVYTADGRITAEDIFYYSGGSKIWRTMLYFGLRSGGKAYYAFDVTDPDNLTFKWKLGKVYSGTQPAYVKYLGETWGKPLIGKIKYYSGGSVIDKWVMIVPGGYTDNAEDSSSVEGKAILIVDAWTGNIVWFLAYDSTTTEQTTEHYLSSDSALNYPIPSAVTAIDKNNDYYVDTIYFGNTGGNLFKIDISNPDPSSWVVSKVFTQNDTDNPIYLPPSITYDNCYNLWITFGTGDRINPKTTDQGNFIAIKDTGSYDLTYSDLQYLSWSGNTLAETTLDTTKNGFYFTFPDSGEKLFDPEPIILPDDDKLPHIFLNTYQPPAAIVSDPCASGGEMKFYDIKLASCPAGKVSGKSEEGRIAGGGFFKGSKYIMYEGTAELGSTTIKKTKKFTIPYAGGIVYWRERRR